MKPISVVKSLLVTSLLSAAGVMAGETSNQAAAPAPPPPAPYEANRGLLTIEGPTGLFINPTSATLPKGAFTAQYCFLLPDTDFEGTIVHGFLISYGVTDWLEFGGIGNIFQDAPGTIGAGGPMIRLRLLKHKGLIPQFSIGSYGKMVRMFVEQASIFAVFTERFEVNAVRLCPLRWMPVCDKPGRTRTTAYGATLAWRCSSQRASTSSAKWPRTRPWTQ